MAVHFAPSLYNFKWGSCSYLKESFGTQNSQPQLLHGQRLTAPRSLSASPKQSLACLKASKSQRNSSIPFYSSISVRCHVSFQVF